jgi:hypothetical protein
MRNIHGSWKSSGKNPERKKPFASHVLEQKGSSETDYRNISAVREYVLGSVAQGFVHCLVL